LIKTPEGKRPFGRTGCRWIILKNLEDIVVEGMNWINMAKNRYRWLALVNTIVSLQAS
jgi:hypothetical protein